LLLRNDKETEGMDGGGRRNRGEFRTPTLIKVRWHEPGKPSVDGWVANLSCGGCQIITMEPRLSAGSRIMIELGPTGEVAGIVRWVSRSQAGLQFSVPLDEMELDRLLNPSAGQADPPVDTLVDRFGRRLRKLRRPGNLIVKH
jgi:hypothetical protein